MHSVYVTMDKTVDRNEAFKAGIAAMTALLRAEGVTYGSLRTEQSEEGHYVTLEK